jgi:hypothetical protein
LEDAPLSSVVYHAFNFGIHEFTCFIFQALNLFSACQEIGKAAEFGFYGKEMWDCSESFGYVL